MKYSALVGMLRAFLNAIEQSELAVQDEDAFIEEWARQERIAQLLSKGDW